MGCTSRTKIREILHSLHKCRRVRANVGLVISSGVQRRVSTDVRTGATVNALQTLSKAQLLQQLGRAGRMDCGVHITMMSQGQYDSQVRSSDLAQLEESDISPMILRSLIAGRSFSRLPSSGADARKGENVPTWNFGHQGNNKDGTGYSMHGPTVRMGTIPVHLC